MPQPLFSSLWWSHMKTNLVKQTSFVRGLISGWCSLPKIIARIEACGFIRKFFGCPTFIAVRAVIIGNSSCEFSRTIFPNMLKTSLHCHHLSTVEPETTISGVISPFFLECHKAAISGKSLAKQLPGEASWLAQNRQPVPLDLFPIAASYTWPILFLQCHQTTSFEPGLKSNGVSLPFFSLCHSLAKVGKRIARDSSFGANGKFSRYSKYFSSAIKVGFLT